MPSSGQERATPSLRPARVPLRGPGAKRLPSNGFRGSTVGPAEPKGVERGDRPTPGFSRASVLLLGTLLALLFPSGALAAAPESPSTYFPAEVGSTTALLHGVLDETAESFPVAPGSWEFLYRASAEATLAECESAGASQIPLPPGEYDGTEAKSVTAEASGLAPDTAYVVCLAAESGGERTVGNAVAFTTLPEAPLAEGPAALTPTSARLEGTLRPPGAQLEYEFRYRRGAGCSGGSSTPLAEGEGGVSATITGLLPASRYTFCLVAIGPGGAVSSATQSFETPTGPPSLSEESASKVAADGASLNVVINPGGLATDYHFEYDTVPYGAGEAAHGTRVPVAEASAGAGNEGRAVSVLLQGLGPATTYFYRAVVANSSGSVEGEGLSFTTAPIASFLLPDGRAFELVSPPEKHGSALEAISGEGGDIQAAADGSALAYIAKAPVGENPAGNRSFASQQLLAVQGSGGWATQDLTTPNEAVTGVNAGQLSEYKLFSPGLGSGVVEPTGATPLSAQAGERTPYRREAGGEYVPLLHPGNVPPGTEFGGEEERGVIIAETGGRFRLGTPDLSHLLLSAPQSLVAGFETGGLQAVYEWAGGALTPVSVLPGGGSAAAEGGADTYRGSAGPLPRNAISSDGSRVFFRTASEGHLYVRELAGSESVRLDAPEPSAEGGESAGGFPVYQGAGASGARAFFTSDVRLTVGASADPGEPDLYLCEVAALRDERSCADQGELRDLTQTADPAEAANVLGVAPGYGEDGSSVYFLADGVLANGAAPVAGAAPGDCLASGGGLPEQVLAAQSCNLYLWRDGTTSLVARLSGADFPDWEAGPFHTDLSGLSARVSPDGRHLAFMSQRPLTGYDNRDSRANARDEEVYLYDAGTGTLSCPSCNPTGGLPSGVLDPTEAEGSALLVDRPRVWQEHRLAASIPGWTPIETGTALYQSRYLSDQGRLFFNSFDGLEPADSNGTADVYEFEPPADAAEPPAGDSCTTASPTYSGEAHGCVSLISSGSSAEESAFLDASGSGADVFFLTASRLLGTDSDNALDVYDAHVCTAAAPCPTPTRPAAPPCEGEACQLATPAPQAAVPATATPGPGNPRHHRHRKKHHKKKHKHPHQKHKTRRPARPAHNHRRAGR
jgi:hypothetical protein